MPLFATETLCATCLEWTKPTDFQPPYKAAHYPERKCNACRRHERRLKLGLTTAPIRAGTRGYSEWYEAHRRNANRR